MKERKIQKIYETITNRKIRIAVLESAGLLGLRHLLIRMDTNNLCDLRCAMCPEVFVRRSHNFKPVVMSLEDFNKIGDMVFPKAQILYLSCTAEPLMSPRFENYIRIAGAHKIPFLAFVTNGMKLRSDVVSACIENHVSQIAISADGTSPETFESVRTGASFSRLLENLSMIRDMKTASKSNKPGIRLNYTVTKTNWFEVDKFIDTAFRYGVDSIQYRPLTPFVNNPWSMENQLDEKEENELRKKLELVAEKALKYGIKLLGHGEFTGKTSPERNSLLDTCVYPWFYRYINPKGDMSICPRRKPVGNLLNSNYNHLMRDKETRRIRADSSNHGKECLEKCRSGLAITEL